MKKMFLCILIILVALNSGCSSKKKVSLKSTAIKFVDLQVNNKYKESYSFYPSDVIGGYKEFKNTSKRVFKDSINYKLVKTNTPSQYIFELSDRKKNEWLIFVDVQRSPIDNKNYVGFGEWNK